MATVALVHGIAQEQRSADALEAEWVPALAGGIRNAGFHDLADSLWRHQRPGALEVRMAFYGNEFIKQGSQGIDGAPPFDLDESLIDELAAEWLNNALESSNPRDAGNAEMELAALNARGESQGIMRGASLLANGLDRIPWMTRGGLAVAGRFNKALTQVGAYLSSPVLRSKILSRVSAVIDDDTKVVVSHSLGSVVAYEVLRDRSIPIPLFITLGSPLALRAVRSRLQFEPKYPAVKNWINLVDPDDVVAARPNIQNFFNLARPSGSKFDSTYTVDNGASPHDARFYLGKEPVAVSVSGVLVGS
ncbi:hypothetical protein ACGFT2_01770 [Streptomyces sp. NPDC048514]|uniref:hypothetical protein n=1 Tax=Streptomyces sp. NPDC048514 TaxID=3365564 RepID=UPI0037238253